MREKRNPSAEPFFLVNFENETEMVNPRTDKLLRRTTMVATVTASYFLLTADYGPKPNFLDPVKKFIRSAESSIKGYIFGSTNQSQESQGEKLDSKGVKDHP